VRPLRWETTLEALTIVSSGGAEGMTCRDFAVAMWPGERCFDGLGVAHPERLNRGAAVILASLEIEGLVRREGKGKLARHWLTTGGKEWLREARK
jgi:hypothetical protein